MFCSSKTNSVSFKIVGNFAEVEALKEINPDLKTIISIGGWNAGNAILAPIAASPELRANLIASSFEYFEKYGFNGLDIDWEYPEAKDKVTQTKFCYFNLFFLFLGKLCYSSKRDKSCIPA